MRTTTIVLLAVASLIGCSQQVEPHSAARIDRTIETSSLPVAVDASRVGTYPGPAKSGAGYFYDEVLEYRVWLHPENGADPLAGDQDYFAAFATYERALKFSKQRPGAEVPLVLVRQIESVNEPSPGQFEWVKEERITEWRTEWLENTQREPNSIRDFLANPPKGASEPAAAN